MKKQEEARYPNSAELFRFCKEALAIKHNNEVKVIDGHVGALLDFDPADCSHWKKGKKNIKSSDSLRTLSDALQVDVALLGDLVSGRTDVKSALQEYKGIGEFDMSFAKLEDLRSDFLRTSQELQSAQNEVVKDRSHVFSMEKESTIKLASEIIERSDVQSCPVLIPEILSTLEESEKDLNVSEILKLAENSSVSPQVRFQQAKEIGKQLLYRNQSLNSFSFAESLVDARCNLFALNLLVPETLFQRALKQVDLSKDFVAALCEIFWVSRSVIQARLQETL